MTTIVYDLLYYVVVFSTLIPVVLLVKQFKHQPPEMRWLMFTLFLSFCGDFFPEISIRFHVLFVNLGSICYGVVAPSFFALFFVHCLKWPRWTVWVISVGSAITTFALSNGLFLQKQAINSWSATLLSLFILAMSITYFYKLITELPAYRIQSLPLFWVISSLFFTHAGKLVLVLVSNYMIEIMKDNLMVLWIIHNILTLVGLIALTWGVVLHTRKLRKDALDVNALEA